MSNLKNQGVPTKPKNIKVLLYVSIVIALVILAVSLGFYKRMFNGALSESTEVWGQFGDYFNVFIGFANLLIVSLLTWGIFDIQQTNEKWKEYQNKEAKDTQKLRYLAGLVNKSISFGTKTVEGLREFSSKIEADPEEIPILRAASSSAISRLVKKNDHEDFFLAYLNKVGDSGSLEFFEALDVIYENYHDQLKDIETMTINNFSRRNHLTELIKEIIDECANLMNIEKADGRHEGDLFRFLNNIILRYYEGVQVHPNRTFEFQQRVFAPILEYFQLETRYLNEHYKKLIALTMKANKSIVPIKGNNLSLAARVLVIADNIEQVIANIQPQIEALRNFNDEKFSQL